jgi:hypothetical protein
MRMEPPGLRQRLEFRPELLPIVRRQLLRVIHPAAAGDRPAAFKELPVHHHRGRHHRPGEGAATDLVDADEVADSGDLFEIEAAQLAAFHRVI